MAILPPTKISAKPMKIGKISQKPKIITSKPTP
jgi:hypothetical protein